MAKVKTYEPLQKITFEASEDIPSRRFIGFEGALCGAGAKALGVSEFEWNNGDIASALRAGTALVELGDDVSVAGTALVSDANGKAIAATDLTVEVPSGATAVLSTAAQPTLQASGGALPQAVNAYAMESGSAGDIIKVSLV